MARESNSEFLQNQEHEMRDEQFFHEDEFNKDVEFGLNKRDSFRPDEGNLKAASVHRGKKIFARAAAALKMGAMTIAIGCAIAASPAGQDVLTHPTHPDNILPPDDSSQQVTVPPETKQHNTDGGWITEKEPTCTQEGLKLLICSICDEIVDSEVIPATGHSGEEWSIVREAVCY
ncbi:MAG: hypothetical protein IKB62_09205, partial [Oscillospiraceae bacterium]|nr:hypothetical protein [Oscillospiraceae bacterium]